MPRTGPCTPASRASMCDQLCGCVEVKVSTPYVAFLRCHGNIIRPWHPCALALALVVGALQVMAGPVDTFREDFRAVTPTTFDSGGVVSRQFHLNAESYIPAATIHRRGEARALPLGLSAGLASTPVEHRRGRTSLADYVAGDPLVDGVIVLHRGSIAFEAYPNMQPWQRHYAWSVSKVLVATAVAVLVRQDRVDLAAPVERYLPELDGTAWTGTSVADIANMASGIDCLDSDGYQTPSTCIYILEESLGITAPTGRNPDLIEHLRSMQRLRPAGERFEYVSANTNVLGLLIERVTASPFALAIESLVWSRIGAEADAFISISRQGHAYASGGLSARLRDLARFGQVYTRAGELDVLSAAQVAEMASAGVALAAATSKDGGSVGEDTAVRAAWQWDLIWRDGAMFKAGYLGQGLYVDPAREVVVAWFGTGLDYSGTNNEMLSVTRQLVRGGAFDTAR